MQSRDPIPGRIASAKIMKKILIKSKIDVRNELTSEALVGFLACPGKTGQHLETDGEDWVNTRRFRRIKVSLKAEHIYETANRPVFIEHISEQGMHMVTLHKGMESQLFPGDDVELRLRLSSGEAIPLRCQVRWMSAKTPPDGVTDSVGLEVLDPPSQYVSFVRTLDSDRSLSQGQS